jgi:hypothetical protein
VAFRLTTDSPQHACAMQSRSLFTRVKFFDASADYLLLKHQIS